MANATTPEIPKPKIDEKISPCPCGSVECNGVALNKEIELTGNKLLAGFIKSTNG
jgi:hypothetical protein